MSIEQNTTSHAPEPDQVSAIENEIPTYRAISPQAVFSLVCGILAILSFAHWAFLLCAAAAIVLGILANRKILRLSDVLTGRGIAQAGIALGLIFGLAAITTAAVQSWIELRESEKFAKVYASILEKGTLEDALWYNQNPRVRQGKTPQELAAEIKKSSPAMMGDIQNAALVNLKSKISGDGADLHFSKIEAHGKDGLDVYAAALFELHPSGSKTLPEDERHALVVMRAWTNNRKYEWWVENVNYPYKPATFKPAPKPVDDGHGHGHAH